MPDDKAPMAVRTLSRAIYRGIRAGQVRDRADVAHLYEMIVASDVLEEAIEHVNRRLAREGLPRI